MWRTVNSTEHPAENWAPSDINKLGLSLRACAIRPSFVSKKLSFNFQLNAFNRVEKTCGKDHGDHSDEPSNLQQTLKE